MTEVDWPAYQPKEGHLPDMQAVFLDLFRLLSIFFSSRQFAERTSPAGDDPISELQEFEISEITRILISTAITGRIVDDREDRITNLLAADCGLLWPDVEDLEQSRPLSLRDAFNKIIHAERIRTDLEQIPEKGISFLNPVMYFYGTQQDKTWKAALRIEDYAREYYSSLRYA